AGRRHQLVGDQVLAGLQVLGRDGGLEVGDFLDGDRLQGLDHFPLADFTDSLAVYASARGWPSVKSGWRRTVSGSPGATSLRSSRKSYEVASSVPSVSCSPRRRRMRREA